MLFLGRKNAHRFCGRGIKCRGLDELCPNRSGDCKAKEKLGGAKGELASGMSLKPQRSGGLKRPPCLGWHEAEAEPERALPLLGKHGGVSGLVFYILSHY